MTDSLNQCNVWAVLIYVIFTWVCYHIVPSMTGVEAVFPNPDMDIQTLKDLANGKLGIKTTEIKEKEINVTEGQSVTLNCSLKLLPHESMNGVPMWMESNMNSIIAHNRTIDFLNKARMEIRGNHSLLQYNLHIKRTIFPNDNGVWCCTTFSGTRSTIKVNVHVPPAVNKPNLFPRHGIVTNPSLVRSFTCSAPYAMPPVILRWEAISADTPNDSYVPIPMDAVAKSDYTMASVAHLFVTSKANNSRFRCIATHPTFNGRKHFSELHFVLDVRPEEMPEMPDQDDIFPELSGLHPRDVPLVIFGAIMGGVFVVALVCFASQRKNLELDVHIPSREEEKSVKMHVTEANHNINENHCNKKNGYTKGKNGFNHNLDYNKTVTADDNDNKNLTEKLMEKKETSKMHLYPQKKESPRRHVVFQMIIITILLLVLFIAQSLQLPFYIRGRIPTIISVKQFLTATAGSVLWLDCTDLLENSTDGLLQVSWRHNFQPIYVQFSSSFTKGGFSAPSPAGKRFANSIRHQRLGAISLHPTIANHTGVFSCEVARLVEDDGETVVLLKTMAAYIIENEMPHNLPLLTCILVGVGATFGLIALALIYTLRFRTTDKVANGKREEIDKVADRSEALEPEHNV